MLPVKRVKNFVSKVFVERSLGNVGFLLLILEQKVILEQSQLLKLRGGITQIYVDG